MAKKPIKKKTTTNPKSTTSETASTTKTTSKTSAAKKSTGTKKTSATKSAPKKQAPNILLRKFDDWKPTSLFQAPPSMVTIPSAPPFTDTSDEKEIKRIKTLLLQTHSPDDFILSPEKKAEQEARFAAHEEARIKAEEEARKKAEEEARIKAEEEARKKAEEDRKQAEEAARIRMEEEARLQAEEEAARLLAEKRAQSAAITKNLLTGAACLAALFTLVIGASIFNASQYFIKTSQDSIEIWKGAFSPRGQKHIVSLPATAAPETLKAVYTRGEVLPIAFHFYLEKAKEEALRPGTPNFKAVERLLKQAKSYASTPGEHKIIEAQLQNIEKTIAQYKEEIRR